MRFTVQKPPSPKGTGYAMKSSVFQNALLARGIDCNVHLVFSPAKPDPLVGYNVVNCDYWLPNARVEYDRFYLVIGSVPAQEAKAVKLAMENQVLPALLEWIIQIKRLPENSTFLTRGLQFRAGFVGGQVTLRQSGVNGPL
ncbi:hypothetical protein [Hymenobacter cellulosilyticus]|uniref:Uncharacterized protein n=1 Tax=Hymenobacter cellulosilyticus TaxID=2932248 RepID=A0A8T9PZE0_9BACT|nr:hypothetical protein [Hymenobacter cellulosilyticus]UOQ70836.1 hypothetical protein MUN79_19415 [Hymenobacter cellulosilyticus]